MSLFASFIRYKCLISVLIFIDPLKFMLCNFSVYAWPWLFGFMCSLI